MLKPQERPALPERQSDNEKRDLEPRPDQALLARLVANAQYKGYNKHKANPKRFGLSVFTGRRGDATLCDTHAGFDLHDMREIAAGLVSEARELDIPRLIWTVADDGSVFEAKVTNAQQFEYHGYPLRNNDPVITFVYQRYTSWAEALGSALDQQAAANCFVQYRKAIRSQR